MYRGVLRGRNYLLLATLLLLTATGVALGQGSPPQYFAGTGHWYQYLQYTPTLCWTASRDTSAARGGYLATVLTAEENNFIANLSPNTAWLGGLEPNNDGTWVWITGEPWSYTSWAFGEPSNTNGDEDYLAIGGISGPLGWNDAANCMPPVGMAIEYNFNPDSSAWCDDFEDANGWQSRWTVLINSPTLVSSPVHTGSGALRFYGVSGNCGSAIYRKNSEASLGTYSFWYNQEHHQAGMTAFIQDNLEGSSNLYGKDYYALGLQAADAQSPATFVLSKRVNDVPAILEVKPAQYVKNEWIRVTIQRPSDNVITVWYERPNGFADTITFYDPNPIVAPGKFILSACADVYPTAHFFDDICFEAIRSPADTLIVGQPNCLFSINHNQLSIPIYLNNHDTVKAIDAPLLYDWPFDPDSISFVGTRTQDFDVKIRSIDAVDKQIRIGFVADNGGSGLVLLPVDAATANTPIAKIMFHLPYQCSQEMIGAPDTCTLILEGGNVQSLKVVDNHDVGYVPALEREATKVLRYKPGDCNGDDNVDISDAVCMISYIFSGGTPVCLAACDANGDGARDISDVVYLIAYIFSGGSMPGKSLLCDYQTPLAKAIPSTTELTTFAGTSGEVATMRLGISTTVEIKGLQLEFETGSGVQITGIQSNIVGMDVFSGTVDGLFRVGLLDMTGKAVIPAGQHDVVTISYAATGGASTGSARTLAQAGEGELKLVNAIVVGEDASKINVTIKSVGAVSPNGALPSVFALSQNTPNPFNPTTEINYALPKASSVHLEVLNVLGQVVRTLVDEFQSAGNHKAVWDGRDGNYQEVSSGVYFYRIAAGEYAETRKMVLMK